MILFAAVPKVYIHALLGHTHDAVEVTEGDFSINDNRNTKDCHFEKFDTPVYYTVFKFILNFLPSREPRKTSFFYQQKTVPERHYGHSPLRGPPVA